MKTLVVITAILSGIIGTAQEPLTAQDALIVAAKNRSAMIAAKLGITQAKAIAKALGAYAPTVLGVGVSSSQGIGATDQDLFVSQSVDLFGKRFANRNAGNAGIQIALAEYSAAASDLQFEVLTSFSQAVSAKHKQEVSSELLQISEALFAVAKRRFEEGKVAELQVTRAAIELERARQSAALRAADMQAAMSRLCGTLGLPTTALILQSDASLEPLEGTTLLQRPDILMLSAKALGADSEARIASLSNRPDLSLQLLRSPWGEKSATFAGRVQLTWSIFDHAKSKNEMSAARAKADASRKLVEDATKSATAQLQAIEVEVASRRDRVKNYEAILVSARDLAAKSQKGYSEGFGTQIDVLEAARALREIEEELVEARLQFNLAVTSQYRAAGFLVEVLK